jgi:hypothetical protein
MEGSMLDTETLAFALEAVAGLDRDLTTALDHADILAAHTVHAARTLWELRRTLRQSVTNARGLREELLAAERGSAEDLLEVALRERSAAIASRLVDLASVEQDARGPLYGGKFHRFLDVSTFVLDQIGRINEAWFRARIVADASSENGDEVAARQHACRLALADARQAFAEIGRDADLARFLFAARNIAAYSFRDGCRALARLLDVDVEDVS